jgi:hypothetical protein
MVAYARQRNAPLVGKLVERAKAAGQVRPDLAATDIPYTIFVLAEAAEMTSQANPDLWRRYLTLVLDGMQPARTGVTPFTVPPLEPEEMEKAMREHAPRRR